MVFLLQSKLSKLQPSSKLLFFFFFFLAYPTKLCGGGNSRQNTSWLSPFRNLEYYKPGFNFQCLEIAIIDYFAQFYSCFIGNCFFLSSSLCHTGSLNTENLLKFKNEKRTFFVLIIPQFHHVLGHPKYCLDDAEGLRLGTEC